MALSHLKGGRKLKTLKDSLLETTVLYADDLFERGIDAQLSPPLPSLPQHLVADILAMSHHMCCEIPEEVLMAGGLILEDKVDRRDQTCMTRWYHFNTSSVCSFDGYEKPVAKLRIASSRTKREETVRKIESLAWCLKDVEVEKQPVNQQNLYDWESSIAKNGPFLKLVRLRTECDVRSLPFRFDYESLRTLEIKTDSGFTEWLETISKCTNLRVLSIDCHRTYSNTVRQLVDAFPPHSELRVLRVPQFWISEEVLHEILSRLASLELLEARSLRPSRDPASAAPEPTRKLRIFLYAGLFVGLLTSDEKRFAVETVCGLAQKVGNDASLDGLLTVCEYAQDQRLFCNAYVVLMSYLLWGAHHEATRAEEVARIERAALVAAKINICSIIEILLLAERFPFSDEFMLRMSWIIVSRYRGNLDGWTDGIERFIKEFLGRHKGSQLARRIKERLV